MEIVKNTGKQEILAANLSIVGWVIIIMISLTAGLITDSITLLLDSSQGLVTLIVAFLVHTTLEKLHKPPDDKFQFGYWKYEPLTNALQGIMIMLTCLISIKFAVQDIIHAEDIHGYVIPLVAAFLGGSLAVAIGLYIMGIARRTKSEVLKTAGWSWLVDSVFSWGIFGGFLIGLTLQRLGYTQITPYVDPVMAVILALFLMATPVKTVTLNVAELLDASPDRELREKVREAALASKPEAFEIDRIRLRKAGGKLFVEITCLLGEKLDAYQVNDLTADFEKTLAEKIPEADITLHHRMRLRKRSEATG